MNRSASPKSPSTASILAISARTFSYRRSSGPCGKSDGRQSIVVQEALKPPWLLGQQRQACPFGAIGGGQQVQFMRQRMRALPHQAVQGFGDHLRRHAGHRQQDAARTFWVLGSGLVRTAWQVHVPMVSWPPSTGLNRKLAVAPMKLAAYAEGFGLLALRWPWSLNLGRRARAGSGWRERRAVHRYEMRLGHPEPVRALAELGCQGRQVSIASQGRVSGFCRAVEQALPSKRGVRASCTRAPPRAGRRP